MNATEPTQIIELTEADVADFTEISFYEVLDSERTVVEEECCPTCHRKFTLNSNVSTWSPGTVLSPTKSLSREQLAAMSSEQILEFLRPSRQTTILTVVR